MLLLAMPGFAHAKGMQADQQCPPGGTVGQTCTDTTNGFVTQGKCTHINVCKAVSWNSTPPKGCGSSGNINAPTSDCPKGPQVIGGNSIRSTTTTTPITIDSSSPINTTIFDQAFSDITTTNYIVDPYVSTTSFDGIEYFISSGEALEAGTPLTEAPPEAEPVSRVTLSLGSVYGLSPKTTEGIAAEESVALQLYSPAGWSFTSNGSQSFSPPVDFFGQMMQLGTELAGSLSQRIGSLFEPEQQKIGTSSDRVSQQPYSNSSTFTSYDPLASNSFFDLLFKVFADIGNFIETHVFPSFPR